MGGVGGVGSIFSGGVGPGVQPFGTGNGVTDGGEGEVGGHVPYAGVESGASAHAESQSWANERRFGQ